MKKKLLPLLVILFIGLNSYSSHYAGGNIYYDCLGNNQYRFWAELTFDCGGAGAPTSVTLTTSNSTITPTMYEFVSHPLKSLLKPFFSFLGLKLQVAVKASYRT